MKVLNKHKCGVPKGSIYIGRGSIWGNPFRIGTDGDRADVIRKYEEYIRARPTLLSMVKELKAKDLVCFCAPQACHGDVLVKLVEELG